MKIELEIRQDRFKSEHEKLVVNMLFTGNWLRAESDKRLKPYCLSSQQYNVLRILRGKHPEPASINDLRERMLDRESNASRLVEKLRQKGLVERSECAADRRAVDVSITGSGVKLLQEIDRGSGKFMERFHTLSPEETSQLNELLDKFRG